MLPRPLIAVASAVFLLAAGVPGRGGTHAESVQAPGSVDWAIALDAARSAVEEKVGSTGELIARSERLISLFDGCASCREGYYRSLSYRLDREFHDRAAVLRALEGQFADDPVELSRLYLGAGRVEDAARVATQGLETVSFVEQRTDLLQVLAQARKGITDSLKAGAPASPAKTEAVRADPYAPLVELRAKLSALVTANETDAAGEVARALIARFPDSISACQACEADWASSARGRDVPEAIQRWLRDCRSIAARCPERPGMWSRMIRLLPERDRKETLDLLLASGLPEDVESLLLLYLGDAIRPADPERALELERQAISHPQYWIVRNWYWGTFSKDRFERQGDIRSALFLELLSPPPEARCSGGECSSMPSHAFRVAYYKLLLGMEPEQQWARMMELMPASPEAEGAGLFHTHEYLDRFARASRSVHQEAAASSWLRGLEGRYAELVQRPGGRNASVYMRSLNARRTLRELQLTVAGYIDELESPTARCEIRQEPTGEPNGSKRLSRTPATDHRRSRIEALPHPGSIEWAIALVGARNATKGPPKGAKELVESYEYLMALNRDCTSCRRRLRERLEYRLKNEFNASEEIDRIDQEFADTPMELSRVLLRTGRCEEARTIALREMKKAKFVEGHLDWVEILAEALSQLGRSSEAAPLVRRLREETPISPEYCTKVSRWHAWLHRSPMPPMKFTSSDALVHAVQEMRSLQQNAEADPDSSCLLSNLLAASGSFASYVKSTEGVGLTEFRALFPEGAEAAQLDLARRTQDPKIRAAILLSTAHASRGTLGRSEALALIREAKAAGQEPEIQVGALREELSVLYPLSPPEEREQVRALARTVIARFPTHEVSCVACEQDWYATIGLPNPSQEIPRWWKTCERFMDSCPDRIDRWNRMAISFGARSDVIPSHAPAEAIPRLLLSRSEAIRSTDPQRALRLEREAVRHPQYPGSADTYDSERQMRAEEAGDFETALYLELLREPSEMGACIPGDRSTQILPQFRTAYYKVQLDMEPGQQWKALIELLPTSPEDPTSRALHRTEHFERIAKAAKVAHEESSAIDWFRLVRRNYADLSQRKIGGEVATFRSEPDPRETELVLGGYIEELQASLCRPGPRTPMLGPN